MNECLSADLTKNVNISVFLTTISLLSRRYMLMTKFDFLENWRFQIPKSEGLVFTIIRWSIFLNEGQFCIFHKLDIHACFPGYARVSQTIWLNFTQETKKCLKQQEDGAKLKIEVPMMMPSPR
jgi:hypothetical protein